MTKTALVSPKLGETFLDDPVVWGRALIQLNDHDPLYVGLTNWEVRDSRIRRFLLAYWCCYSVGASYWLSQHSGTRFWDWLQVAAENERPSPLGGRWPRAHERRHWRGDKCVDSVRWLRMRFMYPEEAVLSLEGARSLGEAEKLMEWPQFGPWIAFKAADMLERVLGVPIEFPAEVTSMYRDPRQAADMAAPLLEVETPQQVTDLLLERLGDLPAPGIHTRRRPVNVQEVETVLCKWKSARRGHYWIGLDTRDHRAELEQWGATDLLAAYPTLTA